jgi:hypothetical protein
MTSLALIYEAKVHTGGTTGTTLWAPIFKIPTLAAYATWAEHDGKRTDTRPLSFGAPVVSGQLGGDTQELAATAFSLFAGALKVSTPLG